MEKNILISSYIQNNELNMEKVIGDYSSYIYTIVKNMTGNNLPETDIEEIISDTFIVLWSNREKLKIEMVISSYLAGITRNVVRNKFRNLRINYDIGDYENELISDEDIVNLIEEREKNTIISNALSNMSEEDNRIFTMFHYSSKRIKEISSELNISEYKVKAKLHRIRKKLKSILEKGGYGYDE